MPHAQGGAEDGGGALLDTSGLRFDIASLDAEIARLRSAVRGSERAAELDDPGAEMRAAGDTGDTDTRPRAWFEVANE